MREQVVEVIFRALEDVVSGDDGSVTKPFSEETVLYGLSGGLSSLGLVALLVAVEQDLTDVLAEPVALADDKAMSQTASPFRTVGTLADYVVSLVTA